MKHILILTGICCLVAIQLGGCKSELKDPLPTSPAFSGVHPDGWTTKTSLEFHGIAVRENGDTECRRCHGSDFAGGLSKLSCGKSGCHGKGFHPEGYANPSSAAFHRFDIRGKKWDLSSCKGCHNADYAGGVLSGNVSCNNTACHRAADGGPQACYTCHGEYATKVIYPQSYPAHPTHLEGTMDLSTIKLACKSCHTFNGFSDPNHIGGSNPNGAEVTLSDSLAAFKTKGTVGTPSYDYTNGSCKNVYCHGNFTNGNNASVVWKGSDQARCGSCHGDPATGNPLPKSPHVQIATCTTCHAAVVDANNKIIDKTKHLDGKISLPGGSELTSW